MSSRLSVQNELNNNMPTKNDFGRLPILFVNGYFQGSATTALLSVAESVLRNVIKSQCSFVNNEVFNIITCQET